MDQIIVFSGEKSEMESLNKWFVSKGEKVINPRTLQIESHWIEQATQVAIALIGSSALATFIKEYINSNKIDLDFSDENGSFKISCSKGSLDKVMNMYKAYKAVSTPESIRAKEDESDGDK